ncbi:SDR family oxidoreductase [Cellulomonas sp. PhB143]|uniref:SDR family oxidoreductase n=1 Tax=Cellulomonas sp. PhB143 TaxID=2485186 RepID=UPI000F49251C|nr:SDR family oxidoreductase [Cellulomonas sp. PhB143]ROS74607.1 NADP-dependent 3-hydroxy acid dehydrogenase YdfG [Cellulomonas sp. PhB143]
MSDAPARVAVVTGAGTGIGRATARALLDAGFRVALAGRREHPLVEAAAGDPAALVVPADVSAPDDVARLFDTVLASWGRVDVLVNNAGTFGPAGSVDEIDPEQFAATLAVNVTGTMLCTAAAFRIMRAQQPQGGRIVNNGSVSARVPRPQSVAYTTSKHALTGLTRSTELDGRPYRITCGQIDIGNVATEITRTIGTGSGALQPDGTRRAEPTFDVRVAAEAICAMASLPLDVSVGHVELTAAGMPLAGRG